MMSASLLVRFDVLLHEAVHVLSKICVKLSSPHSILSNNTLRQSSNMCPGAIDLASPLVPASESRSWNRSEVISICRGEERNCSRSD